MGALKRDARLTDSFLLSRVESRAKEFFLPGCGEFQGFQPGLHSLVTPILLVEVIDGH